MTKIITYQLIPPLTLIVLGVLLSRTTQNAAIKGATDEQPVVSNQGDINLPSPTPIPFAEMTVPYLRKKTFNSTLGEIIPLSDNGVFTSNLTAYTSDNLRINALLTLPKAKPPEGGWPGIVFIHGYIPPSQYKTQEKYVDYVNYLSRNGYVVFKIDLRGHGESDGSAGGGYYSGDYIIDTLNAYAALKNVSFINPEKIGLWGHSMAGNIITRVLAAKPEIKAAVIWAGAGYTYTDLQQFGISDASYRPTDPNNQSNSRRQQLFNTYGRFSPDSPFWQQVVPINYLKSDYHGAIQLHHALDDTVVDINYSRNLTEVLTNSGVKIDLNEYPSGGHNLAEPSFSEAMQKTIAFYQQQLN